MAHVPRLDELAIVAALAVAVIILSNVSDDPRALGTEEEHILGRVRAELSEDSEAEARQFRERACRR